jgi:NAD(P)H dehydrogenase (quinone)
MIIVGLPWSEMMIRSGSYYGATAVGAVTEEDLAQAYALGRRVAEVAVQLRRGAMP